MAEQIELLMNSEDKENLLNSQSQQLNAKSPGKQANQFRSPGPKVAKLLDIFANGSPRPQDSDSEPENAEKSEPKYEFQKVQLKRTKKIRAAQAARLNESYMEASFVISKLLGNDENLDSESANENEESEPTNQVETPKSTVQEAKKALFHSSSEGNQEKGFDVQQFLKNLNSKNSQRTEKATSNSAAIGSRTEALNREENAGAENSPRPTPALAYFHLVSGGRADETPSKRPKLGASQRMQNLLSSFENVDDPIRPKCYATKMETNEVQNSPASTVPERKLAENSVDSKISDDNSKFNLRTTPKKSQMSTLVSNMISQLQNSNGKSLNESEDEGEQIATATEQTENKICDLQLMTSNTPHEILLSKSLKNDDKLSELQKCVNVSNDDELSEIDEITVGVENKGCELVESENEQDQVKQNNTTDLAVKEAKHVEKFLTREHDLSIAPGMSELQKMLLMKSKGLKKQPLPEERMCGVEMGKVVEIDEETESKYQEGSYLDATLTPSCHDDIGIDNRKSDKTSRGHTDAFCSNPVKRNVVEFNSELDIKSATSDSCSNYSASSVNVPVKNDDVFVPATVANARLEETSDSIYSRLHFSRRSTTAENDNDESTCSSSDVQRAVDQWVANPYTGKPSGVGRMSKMSGCEMVDDARSDCSGEYVSTSSEFLSLPRMKRSHDDQRDVTDSRKFPVSTSQQFHPRTSSSQNYAMEQDNLTYSTIGSMSSTCANSGDSTVSSTGDRDEYGHHGSNYDVSDVDCTMVSSVSGSEQAAATASVLMDEIEVQQLIIQQVSRALNIAETRNSCRNSDEQIEAERVLLLSQSRQSALKHELAMLKNNSLFKNKQEKIRDNCDKMDIGSTESIDKPLPCFGNITLSNITLPLKPDEMFNIALTRHSLYYVCLIRYKTQVIATQLVPALPDQKAVSFANMVTFRNVDPSFELVLEIWVYSCLQSNDKSNPQSAKSKHSKKMAKLHNAEKRKAPSFLTSPFVKKSKPSSTSSVESHLGSGKSSQNTKQMEALTFSPKATPGYRRLGFVKSASLVLTRNCVKKEQWLTEMESDSDVVNPLKGTVSLSSSLFPFFQMEFKGFLNMEDVNKGIWHMRWCVLTNTKLCFWKFAENETKRPPIGYVDLRHCEDVKEVSRSVCAIPHAFALDMKEPHATDPSCAVNYRQLLCTDSKESRSEWMRNVELVIVNLKTWSNSN